MRTVFDHEDVWVQGPYARFCEATGQNTQLDLANFLEVRQSAVSDAKRRKSIPHAWLRTVHKKLNVNPLWLLTGEGSKYCQSHELLPCPADISVYAPTRIITCPVELRLEELQHLLKSCAKTHPKCKDGDKNTYILLLQDGGPTHIYTLEKSFQLLGSNGDCQA